MCAFIYLSVYMYKLFRENIDQRICCLKIICKKWGQYLNTYIYIFIT